VLSTKPGRTEPIQLNKDVGEVLAIAQVPYRLPDRIKDGVRTEIQNL